MILDNKSNLYIKSLIGHLFNKILNFRDKIYLFINNKMFIIAV